VDCTLIEGELVPFHFGTLAGEARAQVEAHIVGCARCLQAYLEVKRAIETGSGLAPRPSSALRSRLRADVAAEFVPPRARARMYGAVAASLVAAAGLVGLLLARGPAPAPQQNVTAPAAPTQTHTPMQGEIDSARLATAGPQFL
jgi:hypothetical protein